MSSVIVCKNKAVKVRGTSVLWFTLLVGTILIWVGCAETSSTVTSTCVATEQYTISIDMTWTEDANGRALPSGNPHFTTFVGAVHNENYTMWESGGFASAGVENTAETGGTSTLQNEISAQIALASPTACGSFTMNGGGNDFTTNKAVTVNANFPLVSIISMLAPSSDWFVGLSSVSLWDESTESWSDSVEIMLRPYDAGTEQDTKAFSLSNDDQNPKQPIAKLMGSDSIGFQESKNQHIVGVATLTRVQ